MAELPTIEGSLGRRPVPTPQSGVRSLQGGDVGGALANLGQTVSGIGDAIIEREATAAAKERDTYVSDQLRDLMYNPETGFANSEGRNAVARMGEFEAALERIENEATKDLGGLAGRKLEAALARRMESARDFAAQHASGQRKVWIDGASEARIIAAQQDALVDPAKTQEAIDLIATEVRDQQMRDGLSDEETDLIMDRRVSELYVEQIESLRSINPMAALDYLQQNEDDILPSVAEKLRQALQPEVKKYRGRRAGLDAFERWQAGRAPSSPEAYRSAIASIESRGRKDPYRAVGDEITSGMYTGQRALGRYQVMPGNLPEWSRAALGREVSPEEFLADDDIQDAIFDHRFGLLIEKHGNARDAASAWFTGQPLSVGGSRSDGNIDGREYVRRFDEALVGMADGTEAGMSAEEIEMEMMDTIVDQTELAAARQEFSTRVALTRSNTEKQKQETFKAALGMVWEQGVAPEELNPALQKSLKDHGLWESLGAEYLAKATGVQQFNDYSWLQQNYYSLPRSEQLLTPLSDLKAHMSYEAWSKEVEARAKGQTTSPKRSTTDLIASRLTEFDIDVNDDDDKKNRARVNDFWESYEAAVGQFTLDKGRAPTEAEEQDLVKDITARWDLYYNDRVGPFNTFDEKPAFEVMTEENIANLAEAVEAAPEDVVAAIAFMEEMGMEMNKKSLRQVLAAGS